MSASSNGGKSGFFGILKGLFRKSDAASNIDDQAEAFATSAPMAPPPVEVAPAPAPARRAHSNGNGSTTGIAGIAIPLQSILNGLPGELRAKVRVQAVGDLTINVALDKVLSQLSHGVVEVPFGDIRQAAPHVFAPGVESDQVPVPLPLNEVLSRINPALLVRRGAQRQVEVPSEITSPFDSPGQELSISVGNNKPVQPVAPRRAAPASQMPARGSISSVNTPPAPASGTNPAASIPFSFTKAPTPASSNGPTPFPTITPTPAGPVTPAAPPARQPQPQFHTQFQPKPQPQPIAMPIPMAKAAPAPGPAMEHAVIPVALNAISETWPDGLLRELAQQGLTDARVALPVDAVETGLKRGKVTFNWKALRSWIRPALPPAASAHDAAELELPLKVLAPLFISRKQAAQQPQQKLSVDAEIPNLFFGFPQPEPPAPAAFTPPHAPTPGPIPFNPPAINASAAAAAAASAAAASAAEAAASAAAAFTPKPPAQKPVDTNYYIWDDASDTAQLHIDAIRRGGPTSTEFVKRYASPNEIVSRAAALDGVAGALIALPDGLMVASRIPMELNADTLAAFLPQLFNKVSQCTKELRMGELNNLNFTVGNVPWKIFRVNAIFFAVFGRAAQPLPTAQLAALAAELDRKNK